MGIYNNLVTFDPTKEQNMLESIVPDLVASWTWTENAQQLRMELRQGALPGMTASHSRVPTSSAPGTCCSGEVRRGRRCASIRASGGGNIWLI
jgi:hypothetical protein